MIKNNFILFSLLFFFSTLMAQEKVVLQLKWFHQFQFAGYYVAKEKGFYKEAGLDVEIKERDLRYNNIREVINDKAQYGVADSVLFLYKARKEPIVIVTPIFQHSANVLISRKDSSNSTVYDLNNKNILFYPNDTDGFSILALLKKFDIDANLIRKREKNDYKKIITKEADVMPAYLTNEPFLFKEENVEVNIINPMNYGFDIYGDMLFASKKEALNHPQRVQKFKEASLKGWKYALENKEEVIQLIHKKYNSKKSIEHLRFEAKAIESLISKETIPLGFLDKGRVQYISSLYKEYNLIDSNIDVNELIFEEFKNDNRLNLTKEEKKYLLENPILDVQSLNSFPPYNFVVANKERGYSIEHLKLVSEILDLKINFVKNKSWSESLSKIKNNELDIIPHIAINEDRKKYIAFTDFAPINYLTAIAVRKNSNINSINDLKGKTLSLLKNSFLEKIIKEKFPQIKILQSTSSKESIEAVANGEADAVIGNLSTIDYYINNEWLSNLKTIKISQDSDIPVNVPLYMGVNKDNLLLKSILEKANGVIKNTTLTKLKSEWLIKNFNNHVSLTIEEYEYLKNKKTINYCIDPNWMPLDKIENNTHIGLSSEYINLFKEKLGVSFNLITSNSWENTLRKIKNNSCELTPIMYKTKQREDFLNFSKPYLSFPLVIASGIKDPFIPDLKSLENKKIAYVKEYAYKEVLSKNNSLIEFVEVSSINEGLEKVKKGEVYGIIGLLPVLGYEIQKNFSNSLKISGEIEDIWRLSIATNKSNPLLNSIINKTLVSISSEKKNELLSKWSTVTYEEKINLKQILTISSIFLIILLIFLYKNRQINKLNKDMRKYIKIIDEHVLTSTTNIKGEIIQVSKAFCEISGYTKEELLGQNHRIVKHEDMPKEVFKDLWSNISKGKKWNGEIKNKKKNGDYYWINTNISPVFNNKKELIAYTAIRHDITDKKRIEKLSITDELTGLYNRRHFNDILEREINRAKRDEHTLALIIFDVDFFKQYNDNYGHQMGDYALQAIGKKVKEITKRPSDFAFRIGGEEFAIIFTPHFKENAIEFAKIVNNEIENLKIEHRYNKASEFLTVSIGLYTEFGLKIDDIEDVYNFTDQALYKAKENGRNQYVQHTK